MKKAVVFGLIALTFTAVLASCKSSSGGHCDAYGKANAPQTEAQPA